MKTETPTPDWTALDRQFTEEKRIAMAKVNKNRSWYRMVSRAAGQAFDAIAAELKKESDTTLLVAYENLDKIDSINSWWFLENMRTQIGSIIYNELHERGYKNVWVNGAATKQWEKRRSR
jgi:hypothetical protein